MMPHQSNIIRTYSELILLPTFEERFKYLDLHGVVGEETFRWMRYLNQRFYMSGEWQEVRDYVILRDHGCDLGVEGLRIQKHIIVHHMNSLTVDDIVNRTKYALDPEYLISTSDNTHKAIHYGDATKLRQEPVTRRPNDTCPWKD